jgi:CARDB
MLSYISPVRLHLLGLVLALGCGGEAADAPAPTQPNSGVLSDLSPIAVEAPGQIRLDSLLQLRVAVHNGGSRTAGPGWFVRLFLSPDSLITADDILIDQFVASRELQPGADDRYLRTMKLPGRTEPAHYYLGAVLDVTAVVPELDEDNNVLRSPPAIIILPRTTLGDG